MTSISGGDLCLSVVGTALAGQTLERTLGPSLLVKVVLTLFVARNLLLSGAAAMTDDWFTSGACPGWIPTVASPSWLALSLCILQRKLVSSQRRCLALQCTLNQSTVTIDLIIFQLSWMTGLASNLLVCLLSVLFVGSRAALDVLNRLEAFEWFTSPVVVTWFDAEFESQTSVFEPEVRLPVATEPELDDPHVAPLREADVTTLTDLGYSDHQARRALAAAGGDRNIAAELLLDGGM